MNEIPICTKRSYDINISAFMTLREIISEKEILLMEAAVVERLRRKPGITLHPQLVNASLLYERNGRKEMETIYREYIDLAREWNLPILLCSPTWRTNKARVQFSAVKEQINEDALLFLHEIRESYNDFASQIFLGALIGCQNDCYSPEQGLSADESREFHSWQIDKLISGQPDFLIAETLPATDEALGIAWAMQDKALPYYISFVINRFGLILDGNRLCEAIKYIDQSCTRAPDGYMINCAYPDFLCPESQDSYLFDRLIGYMGNASSLDHCDLDNATELYMEPVSIWAGAMLRLNSLCGIKILGGCCGTDSRHLRYICQNRNNPELQSVRS